MHNAQCKENEIPPPNPPNPGEKLAQSKHSERERDRGAKKKSKKEASKRASKQSPALTTHMSKVLLRNTVCEPELFRLPVLLLSYNNHPIQSSELSSTPVNLGCPIITNITRPYNLSGHGNTRTGAHNQSSYASFLLEATKKKARAHPVSVRSHKWTCKKIVSNDTRE